MIPTLLQTLTMSPAKSTVMTVVDKVQTQLDERNSTQQILVGIQCVFRTLEPWANADTPHPKAKSALNLVKGEVISFSRSLEHSSEVAQLCYNCADNGIMILEGLMDEDITLDEIRQETERTVQDVTEAKSKLSGVVDSLRNNRTVVFKARRSLEVATADIEGEKAAQRLIEGQSKKKVQKITTALKAAQVISTVILVAAAPVCPPLLIVIPIVLPLLELASHGLISHEERKADMRDMQLVNCTEAVKHMQEALHTLERLERSLDSLTSWWGEVDMVFRSIHDNLEAIRKEVNRIRIRRLVKSFTEIKAEFLHYNIGILNIQDYYSRDLR